MFRAAHVFGGKTAYVMSSKIIQTFDKNEQRQLHKINHEGIETYCLLKNDIVILMFVQLLSEKRFLPNRYSLKLLQSLFSVIGKDSTIEPASTVFHENGKTSS